MYLLEVFDELALCNCGVWTDSQELLHFEAKDALPIDKWLWMHPYNRCSVGAKAAENLEFVHKEPSLAVVGGDLANWEPLLSAGGTLGDHALSANNSKSRENAVFWLERPTLLSHVFQAANHAPWALPR